MIYLLEDDKSIKELIIYTLKSQGIDAMGFEKPSDFYKQLSVKIPEIVILDILLPEENGISVLKKIRKNFKTSNILIMLLTAKSTEYDKVIGLNEGADDYLTKPFGMMEFIARIKAMIRRSSINSFENNYSVGNLDINLKEHKVYVFGEEVVLTLKEFNLLELLVRNKGIVFSREKILESIWGYDFVGETRTVDVHIRTLRQKLKKCSKYIQTIHGIGYKIGEN